MNETSAMHVTQALRYLHKDVLCALFVHPQSSLLSLAVLEEVTTFCKLCDQFDLVIMCEFLNEPNYIHTVFAKFHSITFRNFIHFFQTFVPCRFYRLDSNQGVR